jgi:hypothetical protein
MLNVKAKDTQTILDIATLNSGAAEGIIELAFLNNINISDALISGQNIQLGAVINQSNVDELLSRKARPAHCIDELVQAALEGIGYWRVFVDFVVK